MGQVKMADHIPITISPQNNLQVERAVLCHLYILASDNRFKALNTYISEYIHVHKEMHIHTCILKQLSFPFMPIIMVVIIKLYKLQIYC